MIVTLTSVKHNRAASQETNCFSAVVCANGAPVGTVDNDGRGGCHRYHWTDPEQGRALVEWAELQELEFDFEKLDQIVDALLARHDALRWLRQRTRHKTLFRLKGDKTRAWRVLDVPYTPAVRERLVETCGELVECVANDDLEAAAAFA